MHHPGVSWCRLKGPRIKIHLDCSIYLEEFVWGQLALGLYDIADGISSISCSFEQPLRLSLANLNGGFSEFLIDSFEVKLLHFVAVHNGFNRDGMVVGGGLGPILTYDRASFPFMLLDRGHSLQERCLNGDLLTNPSTQISFDASLYPREVWQH